LLQKPNPARQSLSSILKKTTSLPPVRPFIGLLIINLETSNAESKDAAGNRGRQIEHRSWTLSIFDPSNPFFELAVFSSIQMKYHKSKFNRICIAFLSMNAEREVSCKASQIYGDAQIRES
jgi:hypothetical protein